MTQISVQALEFSRILHSARIIFKERGHDLSLKHSVRNAEQMWAIKNGAVVKLYPWPSRKKKRKKWECSTENTSTSSQLDHSLWVSLTYACGITKNLKDMEGQVTHCLTAALLNWKWRRRYLKEEVPGSNPASTIATFLDCVTYIILLVPVCFGFGFLPLKESSFLLNRAETNRYKLVIHYKNVC